MPFCARWIFFTFLLVITSSFSGCTRTIRTQPTITSGQVPVVAAVGKLDTFNDKKAEAFREAHPEQVECVYQKAVGYCYWQDRVKGDRAVLIQTGEHRYDLIKVEVVC